MKKQILTKKVENSKETNWVIVNRMKMESEFGLHVNPISFVGVFTSKLEVLKILSKMTKRDLSWMVVAEFDIVNGKPRKYKIGVPGPKFLAQESIIITIN